MTHPYRDLPANRFWSEAVTWKAPGQLDPVETSATILKHEKVATLGSCFAQHIAREIVKLGMNYQVTERAPEGMSEADVVANGYGLFSARYGNVYTARQALQLFLRAFGRFAPADDVWKRGDRFIDAMRPAIEPDGFESVEALLRSREEHFACVRTMFETCDWLVFTLGLTECWRSREDGTIYPMAPGVRGGVFDESRYEFVNFTASEVSSDLAALIQLVTELNPQVRIILTVSPVPLVATYENRHVLVSTTYSKAALRVAADETERRFSNVTYFPSYEIITSPATAGSYFADDLRDVNPRGVRHVMRMFKSHFVGGPAWEQDLSISQESAPQLGESEVVCDEVWLERARDAASAGLKPRS